MEHHISFRLSLGNVDDDGTDLFGKTGPELCEAGEVV